MKHVLWIFVLLLTLPGCEHTSGDVPLPIEPPIGDKSNVRNILLEDYTGIRCSNCPKAAAEAALLKESYEDRLIVVSIHAGYFAKPVGGYDLCTPAGDSYNAYFKISGNPQGIVNRMPFKDAPFYGVDYWREAVDAAALESPYSLEVVADYQKESRRYTLELKIDRKQSEVAPVDILLWLVEDKIVTMQTIEGGKWAYDYLQRHVFRGALNTTWGERVDWGDTLSRTALLKKAYQLPDTFKEKDCSVVALLCNPETKEVLQVAECFLIESSN